MIEDQPKKRRGRPALGKSGAFTFRVTEQMREKLTAAAQVRGRPVSEEIELRLENSFLISDPLAPIGATVPVAFEMVRSLAQSVAKLRRIAKNNGMREIDTRKALHAAFNHIGDVYFWRDQDITVPKDHIGRIDKPPVHTANKSPETTGYEIADFAMTWNDDLLMEEFGSGQVSNVWSGDGKETVTVADKAASKPLSEILLGDNSPVKQRKVGPRRRIKLPPRHPSES